MKSGQKLINRMETNEVNDIFDKILQHPTGLPVKLGNQISIDIDRINAESASETLKEKRRWKQWKRKWNI